MSRGILAEVQREANPLPIVFPPPLRSATPAGLLRFNLRYGLKDGISRTLASATPWPVSLLLLLQTGRRVGTRVFPGAQLWRHTQGGLSTSTKMRSSPCEVTSALRSGFTSQLFPVRYGVYFFMAVDCNSRYILYLIACKTKSPVYIYDKGFR